jgi:hypothetical protein
MQIMTKTKSKVGVKLAVATAVLFVAAAAALMINTESGTGGDVVAYCQAYDKGIVILKANWSPAEALFNGCQKSGWGMSDVSYSCSLDGKGGQVAYESNWKPCAAGTIAVEGNAQLIVSRAMDSPVSNNYSLGAKDITLADFLFSSNSNIADPASFDLKELVIGVNYSGPRNCLNNFRLVKEGYVPVSSSVAQVDVKKKSGNYYAVVFANLKDVSVSAEDKRTLNVMADVSDNKACAGKSVKLAILPDYSSAAGIQMPIKAVNKNSTVTLSNDNILYVANEGQVPISTKKQGTKSQLKTDISAVNANEFVFYNTELKTVKLGEPTDLIFSVFGTKVGEFKICNNQDDATVQYVNLILHPYVTGKPAGGLEIKVKIEDPVSYEVFLEKVFQGFGNTEFKDADFKNMQIASDQCRTLRVSMDTTQMDFLEVGMSEVVWTDGLVHDIVASQNSLPTSLKSLYK